MTFIQICRRLAQLSSIPGGGPTTTVGQSGELSRVCNWAADALKDVEIRHPRWNFLRKDLQLALSLGAGVPAYTRTQMAATDMRDIDKESMRLYTTSLGVVDEQFIVYWDFDTFRDTYLYGSQTNGRPTVWTIDPQSDSVNFGPIPDSSNYTVRGKYWRRAQILDLENVATDAIVPAFDDEFHMAIVYRALIKYAGYEAAGDAKQTALEEYPLLMRAMERRYLPSLRFGDPLA